MPDIEERINELLNEMTLQEKVALLSGENSWETVANKRLGIAKLVVTDGPHGVRTCDPGSGRILGPATSFPTGVSMAASWNPELIERVGRALGEETKALGCDLLLGPCVNIARHPLWGRNYESYSEDPYLTGQIGVAYVKGVQSVKVGTSLKHFACNNQEAERMRGSSVVDERTLREIYLAHFETIVKEAHPWTVMCSYNRLNGVYTSENRYLLTDILKDEWGYDGVIVSDWNAVHTTISSKKAGLDLEMPGPAKYYGPLLENALKNWQVDSEAIDESVRRILRLLSKAGKLDGLNLGSQPVESARVNTSDRVNSPNRVNSPEHQQLALELAEESITLLKNDQNLLPFDPAVIKSIAVIGPNAAMASIGGGGSSFVDPPYRVSPLAALRAKLGTKTEISYEEGCRNILSPLIMNSDDLTPMEMEGNGLRGEYFLNTDFSGEPTLVRLDRKVDFWWFTNNVDRDFSSRDFVARWTGKLRVPDSANYVFELKHTGKCLLYLDGRMILESCRPKDGDGFTPAEKQVSLDLEGGRSYQLRLEYYKPETEAAAIVGFKYGFSWSKATEEQRMARAVELAEKSDLALIFAGLPESFETECADRQDLELPGRQNDLIRMVAQANPRAVVVLFAGCRSLCPGWRKFRRSWKLFIPGKKAAMQ